MAESGLSPIQTSASPPRKSSSFLASCKDSYFATMPRVAVKLRPSMNRKRSVFVNEADRVESSNHKDIVDGCTGDEQQENKEEHVPDQDSVLHIKVDDLASQLTLISHGIFQELQPCDLKSLKWYNPRMKNHPESCRVNEITRRFNYDGQWTIKQILIGETPRRRAEIMSHFVRVAKRLFELNNFHSSYAIFAALESFSIARLHRSHAFLSKRDRAVWEELGAKYKPDNNWQSFREYQESAGYPTLPHIGFYKTDLIHAYHAYSNPADRDRRMAVIEQRVFDLFSRSNYGFLEQIPDLQDYLKSLRYLEELQKFVDEENNKRSKLLEPDDSDRERKLVCVGVNGSTGKKHHSQTEIEDDALTDCINKTNLIDGSKIEDPLTHEGTLNSSTKHSLRFSQRFSVDKSVSGISALQVPFDFQGCAERKTIVKDGRFRYFPRWKHVWIGVWGINLLTYKPKHPFRSSQRTHFHTLPCSAQAIFKWSLQLPTEKDGAHKVTHKSKLSLELTLISADNAFVLKFRMHSMPEYREWIKYLKGAISATDRPANLISFDV